MVVTPPSYVMTEKYGCYGKDCFTINMARYTHKELMNEWWSDVKKCLVKFHKMTPRQASQKARRNREYFAKHGLGKKFDIFYHEEAFRQAEHITGNEIELSGVEYLEQYIEGILFDGQKLPQWASNEAGTGSTPAKKKTAG
jgi:hypothetical protein